LSTHITVWQTNVPIICLTRLNYVKRGMGWPHHRRTCVRHLADNVFGLS
jgi:hypothetical protein